jgi:hypothetical protein
MHDFSCSGGPGAVSIKSALRHVTSNLCFCESRSVFRHVWGVNPQCTIFHARVARCGLRKKHAETRYAELVFLHPVGSAGHVVHSVHTGHEMLMHYFSCWGWAGVDSTKSVMRYVTPNLCFPSGGICGSRNAFLCVRGVKYRRTFFHTRVGLVRFQYKAHWDTLRQTSVFASSGL